MNETLAILIIDDNKDDRTLCQRSLKEALGDKIRVTEAASGESGLKSIEQDVPHCILLDYSLPGQNGIEVLKRIRAKYLHLPVIMLTGQGNENVAVQSMKEGAQDYIVKNAITPETLERVVRVGIEHSTMQKSILEQRTSLEIFTRALAHDLKEPVRTMRSFLDRITDWRNLNEKSQQSFQFISKAADRMNALIDSVYLYTRLDAPEQMEKSTCHIANIIEDVKENLAQLIEESGATIIYDSLPKINANRVQMIQLFQNLLTNSMHHCGSNVTIHISAEEQLDRWQFVVQDNGPGIDPKYLEKIFEPFKRLSHRKENGSGLGLAINRKIVESYGGTIWCESTLGVETSFLFTLPKSTKEVGTHISLHALSAPPITSGVSQKLARILLVDDNESDIILNQYMLTERANLRCEILTAYNGTEALSVIQEAASENNPIDLILLDLNMPGMTGFELMVELQKQHMIPLPLVVICSTSADDIDRRMVESLGAAGYLIKPPEFALLKKIIERCERLRLCQEGNDQILFRAA